MTPLLAASDAGNALLEPSPGLMIWTLVTFLLSLYVLNRFAFGPIQRALDARREAITESVEAAERTKTEAEALLVQYKDKLNEARSESEAIVERARKAGDELTARIKSEAEVQRAEQLKQTQQQVQAEIDRAMSELRSSVADMTVTAAEKVLKGSLDTNAHQKLIEQAVAELDFESLQKVGAAG